MILAFYKKTVKKTVNKTVKERINNIFESGSKKSGIIPFVTSVAIVITSSVMVSCASVDATTFIEDEGNNITSEEILSIAPNSVCPLINADDISNVIHNKNDEYLTLHDAIYCVNYARSLEFTTEIPHDDLSEYFYDYVGYELLECSYFGNGIPCIEWKTDNSWGFPFHSDSSEILNISVLRPAWGIIVKNTYNETDATEMIYVDAQTGDMYIPTARGGYRPSPYVNRSEYSRIINSGQ